MIPSATWLKPICHVVGGDADVGGDRRPRRHRRARARSTPRSPAPGRSATRSSTRRTRLAIPTAAACVRIAPSSLRSPPGHERPVAAAPQHEDGGVGRLDRGRARRSSSSMVAKPIALRTSGRSMVTTATPASISTLTPAVADTDGEYRSPENTSRFCSVKVRFPLGCTPVAGNGEVRSEAGIPLAPSYGPADLPPARGDPAARRVPLHPRQLPRRLPRAACGRSASTRASARPRSRTRATATCSSRAAPASPSRSTCRRSAATTPTTPTSRRRSAGSASRSTRSPTPRSSSTGSRSTRSAPASRSTAPPRSCSRSTSPSARSRASTGRKLRGTIQNDILKEYVEPRHVDLAAAPVAAADRRHDRVLRAGGAALQRDLGRRRALPRRRRQRRAGDGVHAAWTASPTATR